MKHYENGSVSLELAEIIQINQLVQDCIDFDGFKRWYDSLSDQEQCALTVTLCEFAYQAGFDEEIYEDALFEANIEVQNPLVVHATSFHKPYEFLNLFGLYTWLTQLNSTERFTVFKMFVYLFGKADRNRYDNKCEGKENCGHWWHQDLTDERVVQAILKRMSTQY